MHRLICALEFELQPKVDDGRSCSLIVWLNRRGESRIDITQPGSGKRRIVDLRPGDTIYADRQPHTILAISAYREHRIPEDQLDIVAEWSDGWLLEI
jgi:hypothetical protein